MVVADEITASEVPAESKQPSRLLLSLTDDELRAFITSRQLAVLQFELALAHDISDAQGAKPTRKRRSLYPDEAEVGDDAMDTDGPTAEAPTSQAQQPNAVKPDGKIQSVEKNSTHIDSAYILNLKPAFPLPASNALKYISAESVREMSRIVKETKPAIYDAASLSRPQLLSVAQKLWDLDNPHLSASDLGFAETTKNTLSENKQAVARKKEVAQWEQDMELAFCEKLRSRHPI